MNDSASRFEVIDTHADDVLKSEGHRVLRDRETGVLYLFYWAGAAGGLTVLLDAAGTPLTGPAR